MSLEERKDGTMNYDYERPAGYWRSTVAHEGIPNVAADDMEERIEKVTSFARQTVGKVVSIVDRITGLRRG